jgi:Putative prokaryotic signal transducing protein
LLIDPSPFQLYPQTAQQNPSASLWLEYRKDLIMPETKQICIAIYRDEMTAEIARSRLEAGGIPAFISKDDCGGMIPFLRLYTKIRLMIDSTHEAEATAILDEPTSETE